ncbi:hypothetical protein ABZX95_39830 [Streptomyces sp. NPDC004232]|uniref:hypothetical protein n=1 Tax=Streptomyces sp. NPDC004232 TaxID=3154454 RepID=UPI001D42CA3D|nr:hypothetical protein [Streptomyces sp. tea 10]
MRELIREPIGVAQRAGMRKHFHFPLRSLATVAAVGGPDAQELLMPIAQQQLVERVGLEEVDINRLNLSSQSVSIR